MIVSFSTIAFISSAANAAGQTCVWTGSNSALWSDAANWNNCDNSGAPTTGDILVFNNNGTKASTNDIDGLSVDAVYVAGSDYVIGGNNLTIAASTPTAMDFAGSNNDFQINTTIVSNITTAINASAINTISGGIDLSISGVASDFRINATAAIDLNGTISGTVDHDFVLGNNTGTVSYNSTSIFTVGGVMRLADEGSIECSSASCFGNDGNALIIDGGGILTFPVPLTLLNSITVNSGIGTTQIKQLAASNVNLLGAFTANVSVDFIVTSSGVFWIQSNVVIAQDATISFKGFFGNSNEIFGVVSGDGNIFSNGSLTLIGNNTFTGVARVQGVEGQGVANLVAANSNALGTAAGGTVIGAGGRLTFDDVYGAIETSEPISILNGSDSLLIYSAHEMILNGTITIDTNANILSMSSTPVTINGQITGTGDLTYSTYGGGTYIFIAGSVSNNYVGKTYVRDALVSLRKTDSGIAIPGDLEITSELAESYVNIDGSLQIADSATVTITGANSYLLIAEDVLEAVAMLLGDGNLILATLSSMIYVGADGVDGTFSGKVYGSRAHVVKINGGSWEVNGQATGSLNNSIKYDIIGGTFIANFTGNSGENTPIDIYGGTLKGNSTVGNVTGGSGSISPGESPGCILGNGPMTFSAPMAVDIEIGGPTQCTQYDAILSTDALTLGSATLNLTMLNNYVPADGTVFQIGSATGITGEFAGLSDGDTVSSGGSNFIINYTNSDIVLTAVVAAPVTTTTTIPASGPTTTQIIAANDSASGALPATGSSLIKFVCFGSALLLIGFVIYRKCRRQKNTAIRY